MLPLPTYFHSLYELTSHHLLTTRYTEDISADRNQVELHVKERLNLHTQFVSEVSVVVVAEVEPDIIFIIVNDK